MKKIITLFFSLFALTVGVKAQTTFYVVNDSPDVWGSNNLALYGWKAESPDFLGKGWPGKVLEDNGTLTTDDDVEVTKSENTYTITIKTADVSGYHFILNNNNHGVQMNLSDFEAGKSYNIRSFKVVNNGSNIWKKLAIYNYGGVVGFGDWPGTTLFDGNELHTTDYLHVSRDGNTFIVTLAGGIDAGNMIINNGNDFNQFNIDAAPANQTYTIPAYDTYFYIVNDGDWTKLNLHRYGGPAEFAWPGQNLLGASFKTHMNLVGQTPEGKNIYQVFLADYLTYPYMILNNKEAGSDEGDQFNLDDFAIGSYYRTANGEKVATPSYKLTPAVQYSTYVTSAPMDFTAVDGLTAYKATAASSTAVTLVPVGAVPAGTPLVLKATAGNSYSVPVADAAGEVTGNLLRAADGVTNIGGGGKYDYVLSGGKFCHATPAGPVAVGKAYLHLDSDPGITLAHGLEIEFADGGTTGIESLTPDPKGEGSGYYTLDGRRLQAKPIVKGLYIVNGRKLVIK